MRVRQRWVWVAGAILGVTLAGCEKPAPTPAAATTSATPVVRPPTATATTTVTSTPTTAAEEEPKYYLDHAQPKLRTMKLYLGPKEMEAEIALSLTEVATGMMHRTHMGENDGMLFIFNRPHQVGFYMRNTLIPLSGAYIDAEGVILEIVEMKPLDETPILSSTDKIQYVLETPLGWFKTNNIGVGTLIRTDRGSFLETFFQRK